MSVNGLLARSGANYLSLLPSELQEELGDDLCDDAILP